MLRKPEAMKEKNKILFDGFVYTKNCLMVGWKLNGDFGQYFKLWLTSFCEFSAHFSSLLFNSHGDRNLLAKIWHKKKDFSLQDFTVVKLTFLAKSPWNHFEVAVAKKGKNLSVCQELCNFLVSLGDFDWLFQPRRDLDMEKLNLKINLDRCCSGVVGDWGIAEMLTS